MAGYRVLNRSSPIYVSGFVAAVGSATLPQGSLYAAASEGFTLIEAGWFTADATASKVIKLVQLTSAGTPGATQAVAKYDNDLPAAVCTPVTTHTVAPSIGDIYSRFDIRAAAGVGELYGFHDFGLSCANGTANGIGFLPATTTGSADVVFVWDEP